MAHQHPAAPVTAMPVSETHEGDKHLERFLSVSSGPYDRAVSCSGASLGQAANSYISSLGSTTTGTAGTAGIAADP